MKKTKKEEPKRGLEEWRGSEEVRNSRVPLEAVSQTAEEASYDGEDL